MSATRTPRRYMSTTVASAASLNWRTTQPYLVRHTTSTCLGFKALHHAERLAGRSGSRSLVATWSLTPAELVQPELGNNVDRYAQQEEPVLAFAKWFFRIHAMHRVEEMKPVWRLRERRGHLVGSLRLLNSGPDLRPNPRPANTDEFPAPSGQRRRLGGRWSRT